MTLVSRVLGMIRDIVSAGAFGTSWQWDAFIYAFMLPNFFRRLVGEGALSNAFVPVYSEIYQQEGKEAAFRLARIVLTLMMAFLVLLIAGVEVGIHYLLSMVAMPARLYLTFDLLRIFFPYLGFISLYALSMGILHCHRRFFAPALGPVILNLLWIGGIVWVVPLAGNMTAALRWLAGVLLFAGVLQFAVEWPSLWQIGFRFRWIWEIFHPGVHKTLKLFLPAVLSFAIIQVNILIDMTLGFMIGPGANSSLWYGTRLMQFPLGVFAVAMGTALLPMVAAQVAKHEFQTAHKTLSFALRSIFLIILPSSVGLIILREPIIQLLFEHGAFDAQSTARTTAVLMCYAMGLFGYSGQKLIASAFYALQDAKTPVRIGIFSVGVNLCFNLLLMGPLKEAGLALATSISGIFQFFCLSYFYHRRFADFPIRTITGSFLKILVASLFMGLLGLWFYGRLMSWLPGEGIHVLALRVLTAILSCTFFYVVTCYLCRVRELSEVVSWIYRRRPQPLSAG